MNPETTSAPPAASCDGTYRASTPDELVTATVDAAGLLVELTLRPTAMRMPSPEVATAITEVVRAAQQQARDTASQGVQPPDLRGLSDTAVALQGLADQRLGEFSAVLDRLVHRVENRS